MDNVADITLLGAQAVSTAGDVNGDGFDDVLVGEYRLGGLGWAYIYYGSAVIEI